MLSGQPHVNMPSFTNVRPDVKDPPVNNVVDADAARVVPEPDI